MGAIEESVISRNKQKAHLRSVMTINASTKRQRQGEDWQINFSAHEANIVEDNGNDFIVISSIINNFMVERILIDDRSIIEVLIFRKMGLNESLLRPTWPIYGFTNQSIKVKGLITLSVTLHQGENIVTK